MSASPAIVWFRQDLRLSDNPALCEAAARGGSVVPVYIWAPGEEGDWTPGGASRWWLHQSLSALDNSLGALGSRLVLRCGDSLEVLRALVKESGAKAIYWNRRYEPAIIARDRAIKAALRDDGLTAESFNAALLIEPPHFANKQGEPYKVFTPFWKAAVAEIAVPEPLEVPEALPAPKKWPKSAPLDSLRLEPTIPWAEGMRAAWTPGEAGANQELQRFLAGPIGSYKGERDLPGTRGTSRLSPHLHFGEISPRTLALVARGHAEYAGGPGDLEEAEGWVRQVYWREFAHYLLYHYPRTPLEPLRPEFARFPWADNPNALRAWQKGRTGYPIVDAGMRELWTTGWMHNRVRMIVASFLIKDLMIPWQEGAKWFWDTLVDADLANNTLGWQWTAGCGADAAPYFRIFNPISQGMKFDPRGDYVRRWVPELANLPDAYIHCPWEAPPLELHAAGVTLGKDYPAPMVDHAEARVRALDAYQRLKA